MPSKVKNSCRFNDNWLRDSLFKDWLRKDLETSRKARCTLCSKNFDISNMGVSALLSHQKGSRHIQLANHGNTINAYLTPSESRDSDRVENQLSSSAVSSLAVKNDVIKAEIIWVLKVVSSHFSFNSCSDINDVFKLMFGDSDISSQLSCGKTMCSYICCFGIAPYFKQNLKELLASQPHFMILFDETLNRATKSKQMNVHCRFWQDGQISTRYCASAFMGHAKVDDMLQHFEDCMKEFNVNELTQISMDGPNVNWKFYKDYCAKRVDISDKSLLMIGSCG